MRKLSWFAAVLLILAMVAQASAVPLFPDVPANQWARDAVAQLAAKGLLEGYPDGTFKGDRQATRYEMSMVVARLLAKDEQMWATFATKEDLETLRQLVNTLRDELDALGVRVTNLEDNLNKLTARVWDLEKVRFYGSVQAIAVTQGFLSAGGGSAWSFANNPTSNSYNNPGATGSVGGVIIRPFGLDPSQQAAANANMMQSPIAGVVVGTAAAPGILNNGGAAFAAGTPPTYWSGMPVMDYETGTPVTNGTSLTGKGVLGTKIRVSQDVNAGVEFTAFSGVGDIAVGAYEGVTPSYLQNAFTSPLGLNGVNFQGGSGVLSRLNLDNFWFTYKPSNIKVIGGSFANTQFDSIILKPQKNPNYWGPDTLPFFGMLVNGSTKFLTPVMKWEAFASRIANDTNIAAINANSNYNSFMTGFNLDWEFKGGDFKFNFLRACDDFFGGQAYNPGGVENPFGWRNPMPNNLIAVTAAGTQAGRLLPIQIPNNAAARLPVFGTNVQGTGLLGPQAMTMLGASLRYSFPNNLKFEADYAVDGYFPNVNAKYGVKGQAGRAELTYVFPKNLFKVGLDYVIVSPFFDPFIINYPGVYAGRNVLPTINAAAATSAYNNFSAVPEPTWYLGQFAYIPGFYQLHDNEKYPNNRQGFRVNLDYKFPNGNGNIYGKYGSLQQVKQSAMQQQNITATMASTGGGLDLPGFVEPFFPAIVQGAGYSDTTKGTVTNYKLGLNYMFPKAKLGVNLSGEAYKFFRPAAVNNVANFSQYNNVSVGEQIYKIGLTYPLNKKMMLKGGWDMVSLKGAYQNAFANWNYSQQLPYLGFNYNISDNTQWNFLVQMYGTKDMVNGVSTGRWSNMSWQGSRVMTEVKITF